MSSRVALRPSRLGMFSLYDSAEKISWSRASPMPLLSAETCSNLLAGLLRLSLLAGPVSHLFEAIGEALRDAREFIEQLASGVLNLI
jgi:hypothetical protein